jgi:hypothetical protein
MFDGILVPFIDRRDAASAVATPPRQYFALLLCLATLPVVAAILYPDVFGAPPLEQF